jgi:bacterioferritin-associated ferredoxin
VDQGDGERAHITENSSHSRLIPAGRVRIFSMQIVRIVTGVRAGMIICVCNRISNHDIRAAARAGATCCKQVFGGKGAAPQCGSCVDAMGEILDEAVASGERHLMAAE